MESLLYTPREMSCLKFSNGISLSLDSPLIMGVVNITHDSFYDGGRYVTTENAIKHAERLLAEGADIIDLGAASTKPGAKDIGVKEELKRLLPVIEYLVTNHKGVIISVDTYHAEVAKAAVDNGVSIINDISGGTPPDPLNGENRFAMFKTIATLGVPYILMHIQGTPETMQINPTYTDVVREVYDYFEERIRLLKNEGVKQIIIDPGFGFGKRVEHNFTLLKNLNVFKSLGLPVMAGLSRKSIINKVLKIKPENALTGTIALNTIALLNGANILRVHDVKEAKQVVTLVNQLLIINY